MSSNFVSAGGEESKPREGLSAYNEDAWTKARQKIEELKKPKSDAPGTQEGGKSLYEHLQAQKAAKQEAFEEATKLRNQFRPLDDGEVEFLESIARKEKAEATIVRKETEEQLEAFRRERAAAEEKARERETGEGTKGESQDLAGNTWTATKKRRRADMDDKTGTSKSLRTSATEGYVESHMPVENRAGSPTTNDSSKDLPDISKPAKPQVARPSQVAPNQVAKLVAYDSDSDG